MRAPPPLHACVVVTQTCASEAPGATTLMCVALRGNPNCVRVVLNQGADKDEVIRGGIIGII